MADALGVLALEPRPTWLAELPAEYRRRDVRAMTLADARAWPARAFIKPALDKGLPAKVYASGAELPPVDVWPEQAPVLVSDVIDLDVEWRCFIRDREVRTASPYWRQGRLARTEEDEWPAADDETRDALAFASQVIRDTRVELPPAVVVDVGRLTDGHWVVIEANSAWGAGIYGCDPTQVLHVVRRGCVRPGAATPEDRAWIVERT